MNDRSSSEPEKPGQLDNWLGALAAALEVPAEPLAVSQLLEAARDVAHNVARPAAPLSTFLIGLAVAKNGGTQEAIDKATKTACTLPLSWPTRVA